MTPPRTFVGKLRAVVAGVSDREQVAFGVVGVLRGVLGRVGGNGQAVRVVPSTLLRAGSRCGW